MPEQRSEVERRLQILIRVLAVLGTVLLGLAYESPLLPIIMTFAAVTSYYFTDRWQWFSLNRYVGYTVMVIATVFSLGDFLKYDSYGQLEAIANLLVYVQITLLYQNKSVRIYEQLGIFCLLQVVVAALLNMGFPFGVMLVVYLVVGLAALALFFLFHETQRVAAQRGSIIRTRDRMAAIDIPDGAPTWKTMLGRRPVAYFEMSPERFGGLEDVGGFSRQVGALSLATLVFAACFYYGVPRYGGAAWQEITGFDQPTVGFSAEPTIDELGRVLQSDRIVMRVAFVDPVTNTPVNLLSEPYLRGSVLSEYRFRGGAGHWRQDRSMPSGRSLQAAPDDEFLLRQEITMEPGSGELLFMVAPGYSLPDTPSSFRQRPGMGQLYRPHASGGGTARFSYAVGTTAYYHGVQRPAIVKHSDYGGRGPLREAEKGRLTQFDPELHRRLAEVAEQELEQYDTPRDDRVQVARTLRNHFQRPGRYTYTLDLTMHRDRHTDPLEAFVADHRRGHCQYFAGALVLMLRSQGIPARMVIGYQPDEFNTVGNYFVVREKHAHAWVEAYLEPDQVPSEILGRDPAEGAWIRLDPTPGATETGVPLADRGSRVGEILDYAQLLWNDYVMEVGGTRGPEDAYEDSENHQPSMGHAGLYLQDLAQRLWKAVAWITEPGAFGRALGWRWALGFLLLVALTASLMRHRFAWWQKVKRLIKDPDQARHCNQQVEFYVRFEQLLARLGLHRAPYQTAREFARSVRQTLVSRAGQETAEAAESLVGWFYEVRFGGRPLDNRRHEQIEHALSALEQRLQPSGAEVRPIKYELPLR